MDWVSQQGARPLTEDKALETKLRVGSVLQYYSYRRYYEGLGGGRLCAFCVCTSGEVLHWRKEDKEDCGKKHMMIL